MKAMSASKRPSRYLILLLVLFCSSSANELNGAETPSLKLPAAPMNWINSPPLTAEMLTGKAALFYLYEEG